MTINYFSKLVTLKEGKKVQISIAQVKEVLRIVNDEFPVLYLLIRAKDKKKCGS